MSTLEGRIMLPMLHDACCSSMFNTPVLHTVHA
jgi:hypothetical protein